MLSKSSQTLKKLPVKLAFVALQLVPSYIGFDKEPMYAFDEKTIENLTYLCDLPFISFDGEEIYKSLEDKAAILFYHTIKNHLFENGNKRTAVILVLLFYIHNEKWLDIDENKLYDLSLHVASSESSRKEEVLNDIKTLFRQSETEKPKGIAETI